MQGGGRQARRRAPRRATRREGGAFGAPSLHWVPRRGLTRPGHTPRPTPCTPHPTPCTPCPTPHALHSTPHDLHPGGFLRLQPRHPTRDAPDTGGGQGSRAPRGTCIRLWPAPQWPPRTAWGTAPPPPSARPSKDGRRQSGKEPLPGTQFIFYRSLLSARFTHFLDAGRLSESFLVTAGHFKELIAAKSNLPVSGTPPKGAHSRESPVGTWKAN